MRTEKVESAVMTHLTLANAVQICNDIFVNVAGEEISTQLGGERMYGSALQETLAVKFRAALAPHLSM